MNFWTAFSPIYDSQIHAGLLQINFIMQHNVFVLTDDHLAPLVLKSSLIKRKPKSLRKVVPEQVW